LGFFFDSITSRAYWRYALLSGAGLYTVLAFLGGIMLFIEALDFFRVLPKESYAPSTFFWVLGIATAFAIAFKRPIRKIEIPFAENDFCVEVRIGDIFESTGAAMVSTNTDFESDVAGGKISPDSLQGQLTAKYFTGDQSSLIGMIQDGLKDHGGPPYPMGTTVPIKTHGKTFYLVAMADLNENGNASTTLHSVEDAMNGLWDYVRASGELQELIIPVVGMERGRLNISRKKMIEKIAESFAAASSKAKISNRLVIMVRPEDAVNFRVNLYDIKDHLNHTLERKK
jgi:hypothetical protein